jgi:hypothetical protein
MYGFCKGHLGATGLGTFVSVPPGQLEAVAPYLVIVAGSAPFDSILPITQAGCKSSFYKFNAYPFDFIQGLLCSMP